MQGEHCGYAQFVGDFMYCSKSKLDQFKFKFANETTSSNLIDVAQLFEQVELLLWRKSSKKQQHVVGYLYG